MLKLQGICLKHTQRGPRCLFWEVATIRGASLPVGRAVGQVRRGTAWEVMHRCPPSLPPTPFSLLVAAPRLNWARREAWRESGQAVCRRGPEGTGVTAEVPLAGFVSSWLSHDTPSGAKAPWKEGVSFLPGQLSSLRPPDSTQLKASELAGSARLRNKLLGNKGLFATSPLPSRPR